VDLAGHKDILGMWAGDGDGESAKFWYAVLTDLKARGVKDVFFVVCDGLKGLPDSVNAVFPLATVQTCIIHLMPGGPRPWAVQRRGQTPSLSTAWRNLNRELERHIDNGLAAA